MEVLGDVMAKTARTTWTKAEIKRERAERGLV
jgi:hypothetical protein